MGEACASDVIVYELGTHKDRAPCTCARTSTSIHVRVCTHMHLRNEFMLRIQVEELLLMGEGENDELQEMYNSLTEVCAATSQLLGPPSAASPAPPSHAHAATRGAGLEKRQGGRACAGRQARARVGVLVMHRQ